MPTTYTVIRRPLITEKGLGVKETQNTLVFEVAPDASSTPRRLREPRTTLGLNSLPLSTSSAVRLASSLSSAARYSLALGSLSSRLSTTRSLPSASFAASAARSAPRSFFRGNA